MALYCPLYCLCFTVLSFTVLSVALYCLTVLLSHFTVIVARLGGASPSVDFVTLCFLSISGFDNTQTEQHGDTKITENGAEVERTAAHPKADM